MDSLFKRRPKTGPTAVLKTMVRDEGALDRPILNTLREALIVLDAHLRVLFANRAFFRMFAVGPEHILGKSIFEINNGAWNHAQLHRLLTGVINNEISFDDFEVNCQTLRLGLRTFVLYGRILSQDSGLPGSVLLSFEDITLRKRLEKRRQRNAIIESSHDAITGANLDGTITSWNPAAERLYGYTAGEAIGRSLSLIIPDGRKEELEHVMERIRQGDRIDSFETERVAKDGRRVYVRLSISPIHDASGQLVGASAIASNITEWKRAEEQRQELNAKVLHQEKLAAVGLLASGLAHEIGNPLASIQAICDNQLRKPLDPAVEEKLRRIRDQVVRIVKIVHQLVDFSRRESETWRTVSINAEIDSALTMARLARSAKRVEVKLALDSALPETFVLGDQLAQVFLNLFLNAFDSMADTGGVLTVRSCRTNDGQIRIAIEDNGSGIAEENLKNIFMPFFTTKETGKGTGLGLHISHGIIKRHGGELSVRSAPGKGSTFTVDIPYRRERPKTRTLQRDAMEAGGEQTQ
jgi:PAS domain S-box-containing protein